jgi:uncharacterized membrane protein
MLAIFACSLKFPPTVIERFARLKSPQLSLKALAYTRKVTVVWCCFFVVNASIALYTVFFASTKIWTLYNCFISYCLMVGLLLAEFLVRTLLIKSEEN